MTAPLLVIAAGGTGGHMFPAQSLAEAMLARGWRVKLSTDERGARYTQGFPHAVEIDKVASATFARGGLMAKLRVPLRIMGGTLAARAMFRQDRPTAVVGFGGYPAIPAVGAATLMKLPRMIHEQNGVLGRVNQVFATRVDSIACGIWPTDLPEGVTGIHVGNPVRATILERAAAPYMSPGEHPMSILVIGGSQGARVLSDVVPSAITSLPAALLRNLRVSHQAREEDAAQVTKHYADAGVNAEVLPFFHDVPARMAEAQLVISRSGASSIADLSVIGRPSILIPYAAAAADHQTANARGLVDAGAADMLSEKDMTPDTLGQMIAGILNDPARATAMAEAALTVGKPQAAETLADMVEELANKKNKV